MHWEVGAPEGALPETPPACSPEGPPPPSRLIVGKALRFGRPTISDRFDLNVIEGTGSIVVDTDWESLCSNVSEIAAARAGSEKARRIRPTLPRHSSRRPDTSAPFGLFSAPITVAWQPAVSKLHELIRGRRGQNRPFDQLFFIALQAYSRFSDAPRRSECVSAWVVSLPSRCVCLHHLAASPPTVNMLRGQLVNLRRGYFQSRLAKLHLIIILSSGRGAELLFAFIVGHLRLGPPPERRA